MNFPPGSPPIIYSPGFFTQDILGCHGQQKFPADGRKIDSVLFEVLLVKLLVGDLKKKDECWDDKRINFKKFVIKRWWENLTSSFVIRQEGNVQQYSQFQMKLSRFSKLDMILRDPKYALTLQCRLWGTIQTINYLLAAGLCAP
jgi:hypothetical protein